MWAHRVELMLLEGISSWHVMVVTRRPPCIELLLCWTMCTEAWAFGLMFPFNPHNNPTGYCPLCRNGVVGLAEASQLLETRLGQEPQSPWPSGPCSVCHNQVGRSAEPPWLHPGSWTTVSREEDQAISFKLVAWGQTYAFSCCRGEAQEAVCCQLSTLPPPFVRSLVRWLAVELVKSRLGLSCQLLQGTWKMCVWPLPRPKNMSSFCSKADTW